ncbi:sugar ABC transporter substrate-binding protein [soil metagenome]
MGREGEVAPELLAGFERENPGVRLRVEQLPWSAAHEKLLTAVAGDATPDVAQMGNTWLPEMAALGALEPLQPWLNMSRAVPAADYFEGIWRTNSVDGVAVGVPWYVDTRLLFVRRDLLLKAGVSEMPATWAEWLKACAALQASGVKTPLFLPPPPEFEPLLALALQQDDEVLKDQGTRGNFSGPGFRRALQFYMQLFERGFAPGLAGNTVANIWQEIGRGTFAFYISGPWNIGEFKRRLPAELQDAWATAPLPGPTGLGASVAGGASLVMFKRSTVKPLVWKLIEYLSRPAVQQQFYRLTGNLPPRRSTWGLPMEGAQTLADDPHARAFFEQLSRVRATPGVPEWERIAQEMQLAASRTVFSGVSVDETVSKLDARVDGILDKRRWMMQQKASRKVAA